MTQIELMGLRSRSGYSETLAERILSANAIWTTPMVTALRQTVDPFIVFQPDAPVQYLIQGEQRVMKKALLRSTRLISRG